MTTKIMFSPCSQEEPKAAKTAWARPPNLSGRTVSPWTRREMFLWQIVVIISSGKLAVDGIVTTLAGSPGQYGRVDGTGEAARFWYPVGIAVDASGNVYVADSSGQAVRKVTPAGAVSTRGTPETAGRKLGFGSVDHFHNPLGIALDKDGNVFVADSNNFVIRKIAPDGSVTTVAGQPGTERDDRRRSKIGSL